MAEPLPRDNELTWWGHELSCVPHCCYRFSTAPWFCLQFLLLRRSSALPSLYPAQELRRSLEQAALPHRTLQLIQNDLPGIHLS